MIVHQGCEKEQIGVGKDRQSDQDAEERSDLESGEGIGKQGLGRSA
jgi:hypothetical protein